MFTIYRAEVNMLTEKWIATVASIRQVVLITLANGRTENAKVMASSGFQTGNFTLEIS